MKNFYTGVVGLSLAVSAVLLTIVVCVVSYRVVFGSDHTSVAEDTHQQDTVDLQGDDAVEGVNVPAKLFRPRPRRGDRSSSTFIVAVDGDDMLEAQRLEKNRIARLLRQADELTGKGDRKSTLPKKPFSFQDLPDEEKNRIWWQIASVAKLSQGDSITYTLTIVQARKIGKMYETSVLEVFNLFRAGADAEWRTATDPGKTEDDDS